MYAQQHASTVTKISKLLGLNPNNTCTQIFKASIISSRCYHEESPQWSLIVNGLPRILPSLGNIKDQGHNFVALQFSSFLRHNYLPLIRATSSIDDVANSITRTTDEVRDGIAMDKASLQSHDPEYLFQNLWMFLEKSYVEAEWMYRKKIWKEISVFQFWQKWLNSEVLRA